MSDSAPKRFIRFVRRTFEPMTPAMTCDEMARRTLDRMQVIILVAALFTLAFVAVSLLL